MAIASRKGKSRPGRPSLYKSALAGRICERLADGETLRRICRDEGMPTRRTVTNWLLVHEDFRQLYARARDIQADLFAEEVVDIADDRRGDLVPGKDGKPTPDWENVQRSRLRVDARKWFAGKVAPKKYGERIMQELSGP